MFYNACILIKQIRRRKKWGMDARLDSPAHIWFFVDALVVAAAAATISISIFIRRVFSFLIVRFLWSIWNLERMADSRNDFTISMNETAGESMNWSRTETGILPRTLTVWMVFGAMTMVARDKANKAISPGARSLDVRIHGKRLITTSLCLDNQILNRLEILLFFVFIDN